MSLKVSYLSDSMLKHLDSTFAKLGHIPHGNIHSVPGSEISKISELAQEFCTDSDLIVVNAGINNLLNGFSISNCMYCYDQVKKDISNACPTADLAFVSISYISANEFSGVDQSDEINPLVNDLNNALFTYCKQNDRVHFFDLTKDLEGDGSQYIQRSYLATDGLHYSKHGLTKVANSLIKKIEALKHDTIKKSNDSSSSEYTLLIDSNWPELPQPAVKSRVHPANYPGQQYVSVRITDHRTNELVINEKKQFPRGTPVTTTNKTAKKHSPIRRSACDIGRQNCHNHSKGNAKPLPRMAHDTYSKNKCYDKIITPVVLNNRFSVLTHEENDNKQTCIDNQKCESKASPGKIKKLKPKLVRTYHTSVPYKKAESEKFMLKNPSSTMFANPYRVSVFSTLTWTKSCFLQRGDNEKTLGKNEKKTEFFFNTVPEFLQALNLSVSSPLVSKLLIAYGVKISATYEANGDHATCANAGNLIHYILIFLLNTTRPSNETFSRVCTQTGMQLTHYNDVYGEYFISYITRGLIINLSRNYFDEQLLLLCGDIETNPGPRKKADHKNKIARLKGIPSQQMKKNEATRMNNEEKSCMSDIENCGKQYEIMSATAGNFHQGDLIRFHPDSAGKQCTCNALISLCCLPNVNSYSPEGLDNVLMQGNELYCDIQRQLQESDRFQYLTFDQLPCNVTFQHKAYTITKYPPCYVNIHSIDTSSGIFHCLQDALHESLSHSDRFLIMIGDYAMACYRQNHHYYFFDSHSRNTHGQVVQENGTSVLLQFDTLLSFSNYIREMILILRTETHLAIECMPIKVSLDNESWLQSYMNDQTDRQLRKSEYNRLYKRKQRENPDYKNVEKEHRILYKKHKSYDTNLKNKEKEQNRTYIKKKRSNADYRTAEKNQQILYLKNKRLNIDYKNAQNDQQLLYNQKKRKHSAYRAHEKTQNLAYMKAKRYKPEYKNSEKQQQRIYRHRSRANLIDKNAEIEQNKKKIDKPVSATHEEGHSSQPIVCKIAQSTKSVSDLKEVINRFHETISTGPVFVCTCCHQTWFSHSVVKVTSQLHAISKELQDKYFTRRKSHNGIEWLCKTCLNKFKMNTIPKLAVKSGLAFPYKPPELDIYPLEERLISLRIPFMSLYNLPRGGQLQLQGSVVNVPVDIVPVITSLPRTIDESATIPIQLKRKLSYKNSMWKQNVRPRSVLSALHFLMDKELYKSANLTIDEKRLARMLDNEHSDISEQNNHCQDYSDSDSDHFSECDPDEKSVSNLDTMLDEEDIDKFRTLTFAPGEGQHPLNLFQDSDAEYLSFPTIYCGERMNQRTFDGNKIHYAELCKWELRHVDRRVSNNVPNLFFKAKKLQIKQVAEKGILAMKRVQSKGNVYTAGQVLDTTIQKNITNLDEGYHIFRSIRNSPPYLSMCKKEIMAMIRQLGLPTWFVSLSAADTKWHDLIIILGKLNEDKDYTDDIKENKMTWDHISKLLSSDPVTCARYFNNRIETFIRDVLYNSHNPIHKIVDYVYRVEFQHRGSPHIHMLIWTENGPEYGKNNEEEIIAFNDQYISCSTEVHHDDKQYVDMQKHRHSRSCRKKGKAICRFGFPIPPMPQTVILEPYQGDDRERLETLFGKIKKELDDMKDGSDIAFNTFLQKIDCCYEDYINAICTSLNGPKLFLSRNLSEIRINPYMKHLLNAWKGNHDIQFVLDPYACAVYITDYISESQRGMSTLLHNACKEARQGNDSLRKQVRFMGNKFLNATEMSAQEAVYLTLQLPLTRKTREVVFLNTSPPEERTCILKTEELLKNLPPNSTDIYASNQINRYSKRPRQLDKWCLADYVSKLNVYFPPSECILGNPYEDNYDDDLTNGISGNGAKYDESDDEDHDHDENDGVANDNALINIELKNGIKIKSRKVPRVIRFVRYSPEADPENYYREQLLLFWPWRNECKDLLHDSPTYSARYQQLKNLINISAKQYDHKCEALDKAIELAEAQTVESHDSVDDVAPSSIQQQRDDEAEGVSKNTNFEFFDPKRTVQQQNYDIGKDMGVPSAVSDQLLKGCIPDNEYYALIRKLNFKQREIFLHINQWIRTKSEPLKIFLSGGAGTGKSVLITALYQSLNRYLILNSIDDLDHIRVLKCAPTGAAAFNIEGITLHHAFDIPVQQKFQPLIAEKANNLYNRYKHVSVLIVDEISLVSNMLFKQIDTRLQQIKKNTHPFGNIHMILVGDLFQLEPVSYTWIFKNLNPAYGPLATNLWNSYFTMYELTEIMRQKEDKSYAELLNRLREGNQTENDIKTLKNRIISETDFDYPYDATHMFSTNAEVDAFNEIVYDRTSSEKVLVKAKSAVVGDVTCAIREKTMIHLTNDKKYTMHMSTGGLRTELKLAIGLQYDCTVNLDVEDGLTNGATCTLKKIEYKPSSQIPAILWVQFLDAAVGQTWRQKYNNFFHKSIKRSWTPIFAVSRTFTVYRSLVSRQQFPLSPSSARTIHKCQGKTISKAVIKMSTRKSAHSHYTALSRVTSIDNLIILHLSESKIAVHDSVKQEMSDLRCGRQVELCYTPVYQLSPSKHRIVFQNIRSLNAHFDDVQCDANYKASDILGFVESRLAQCDNSVQYQLSGFHTILRNDQKHSGNTRPPHGIAIYIRDSYSVSVQLHASTNEFEYSILKVSSPFKETLQIVVLYKSNTCPIGSLKTHLNSIKTHITFSQPFLILGDFNIDVSRCQNASLLSEIEDIFNCKQLVKQSTTIYHTIIDLVFSNYDSVTIGLIESVISDHKLITVECWVSYFLYIAYNVAYCYVKLSVTHNKASDIMMLQHDHKRKKERKKETWFHDEYNQFYTPVHHQFFITSILLAQ